MRPTPMLLLLSCALLAAPAAGLGAQSAQRFSLQGSALYVRVSGDAYEELENGIGFEAQARFNPGALSIGAGYQRSSHGLDAGTLGDIDVALAGPFIEPRWVVPVAFRSAAPYLAARIAFLKQSADIEVEGTPLSLEAGGTQINLGGGVLVRLSRTVNLDLGVTFGRIAFDDVEISSPGLGSEVVEDTGGNGTNLVLRAGLAIGLGR